AEATAEKAHEGRSPRGARRPAAGWSGGRRRGHAQGLDRVSPEAPLPRQALALAGASRGEGCGVGITALTSQRSRDCRQNVLGEMAAAALESRPDEAFLPSMCPGRA